MCIRDSYFLQVHSGAGPVLPYPEDEDGGIGADGNGGGSAEREAEAAAAAARAADEEKRQAARRMEDFTRNIERKKDKRCV